MDCGLARDLIYYFANFKIPLTRNNWLLKFGFTHRLAQILEPKLLVHEILKFAGIPIKCMHCKTNFKTLLTRLSNLLNLGLVKLATKFRRVICQL